jgi:hypothetical protein
MIATLVDPAQQLLEMHIDRQRARLVDNLGAGAEPRNDHGTALAVDVPSVTDDLGQEPESSI